MSKPQKPMVDQPENLPLETDPTELEPKLNRLEEFLKAKAAKQHPSHKGGHFQGKVGHSKLKERVRRRP